MSIPGHVWPSSTEVPPNLAEFVQIWPNSAQTPADYKPSWPMSVVHEQKIEINDSEPFGRIWRDLAQLRPYSAQVRPIPGQVWPIQCPRWLKFADFVPISAELGQRTVDRIRSDSGPKLADVGRVCPKCVRGLARLGLIPSASDSNLWKRPRPELAKIWANIGVRSESLHCPHSGAMIDRCSLPVAIHADPVWFRPPPVCCLPLVCPPPTKLT